MKIYNKTTGRYYKYFNSQMNLPVWSAPHRPSQATLLSQGDAEAIVRQLCAHEPALDLQIVGGADSG